MKKRDLEILKSLERFKCLERDQIAALHFFDNANPIVSVNRVLKRLRDSGYILANTNRSFQQYIYFLNPSPIKTDSQKIDHYLMIAQGYIDMGKYSPIKNYRIETKLEGADIIPDVSCEWLGKKWFLEFQNSVYTTHKLYKKLNKYVDYYNKGYWDDQRVLVLGKMNLKFEPDNYPFKFKQVRDIEDLSETIQKLKELQVEKNVLKRENGKFKIVIN